MYSQNGEKFEIWLELLLKKLGYQNVMRNVEYRKEDSKREVDICYNVTKNGKIYLALIEAKYTKNKSICWKRKSKKSQIISIDNLIDEVWERHLFVGADFSLIATNSQTNYKTKKRIGERKIKILDGTNLLGIYQNLGGSNSLEDSIRRINVDNHKRKRNIIYI